MSKYQIIYADPPWPVAKIRRECRPNQTTFDYPTMTLEQIQALPIEALAEDNCLLFLWTTQAFLPKAFTVMDAWGFKYQRTITWDKKNGLCLFGFHYRTEFLLVGYRGKIDMYPRRPAVPTIFSISSKNLLHSQKPDEIRKAIEVFGTPRIELFARQKTEGWDVWGNEVESDIVLPVVVEGAENGK